MKELYRLHGRSRFYLEGVPVRHMRRYDRLVLADPGYTPSIGVHSSESSETCGTKALTHAGWQVLQPSGRTAALTSDRGRLGDCTWANRPMPARFVGLQGGSTVVTAGTQESRHETREARRPPCLTAVSSSNAVSVRRVATSELHTHPRCRARASDQTLAPQQDQPSA